MLDSRIFFILVVLMVLVVTVAVSAIHLRTLHHPPGVGGAGMRRRTTAVHRIPAKKVVRHDIWPAAWTHEAPSQPFTIAEAHNEMQRHRNCGVDICDRKAAALRALVEGGKVKLDSSRHRA
ncbi:hypothetical protein [Nocardia sp. NPDC057440]|uniref:hypothetical protein n=1 Tax=Nocardia sp. NPDC057440 TaxID=3346134 RepID=UPI00366DC605